MGQDDAEPTGVPAAPYPPMQSSRYPSAHVTTTRSSLSSTPQYTSSSTTGTGRHGGDASNMKSPDSAATMEGSSMRRGSATATSVGVQVQDHLAAASSNARVGNAANTAARQAVSRIQFCHANVVACINCQPPPPLPVIAASNTAATQQDSPYAGAPSAQPTPPRVNRKLGPILLDLRQIVAVPQHYSSRLGQHEHHHQSTEMPTLFTTRTLTLSRGNPSLGTSVSSTCLDVSSILPAFGATQKPSPCATGLTTGALCIHTFSTETTTDDGGDSLAASIEYFHTPRHHRPATAVSWRSYNSRHVAVGLVSSAMAGATPISSSHHHHMNVNNHMNMNLPAMNARRGGTNNPVVTGVRGGGGGGSGGGGDREFCCFLWDIEHQAAGSGTKRTNTSPLFKLSHNAGVASLAWLLDGGQTLAVGGQQRNIQLYDLRVSGTSSATPPISAFGHNFGVHGIEVDPFRPHQFATFSRSAEEPVKIWDARRMDSVVSEIKIGGILQAATSQSTTTTTDNHNNAANKSATVSALRWSSRESGVLSISIADVVLDYDTSSRPVLSRVSRGKGPILDMALYPGLLPSTDSPSVVPRAKPGQKQPAAATAEGINDMSLITELYPQRMLVVVDDRSVQDMAKHTSAPLAVSRRDGRVVHSLGKYLFLGTTRSGPMAMESLKFRSDEDISATMMRRARCVQVARYSMDTTSNIRLLAEEAPLDRLSSNRDALLRLWTWIDRMESLCGSHEEMGAMEDGGTFWSTKGFDECGVWKLLDFDSERHTDTIVRSDALACDVYESPVRRAGLTACGWTGRFDLSNVLAECESLGEYERSAALAVFHGSLGSAVDALQRGADAIHRHFSDNGRHDLPAEAPQYAETLQLVAMCIAGFGGIDSKSPSSGVWRKACESLMRRPDMSGDNLRTSRTAYLRALCTFLINISTGRSYDGVLEDNNLSLCDRVAFACRFLGRVQLQHYLQKCVDSCQASGNIEGLVITGIAKEGIRIIQSYVDQTADVQTAALVTSRVILPVDWTPERRICAEFLDAYRTLLNTWQMWQSRAMFDVDRADLLRRIKIRQADAAHHHQGGVLPHNMKNYPTRRVQSRGVRQGVRQPDPDIFPSVPAQLDARCTYCSASLGLRRLDNHANQWLSKMKPVLSCCPSCQKPLPRCAICLLSLGALNPYMELTRERERTTRVGQVTLPVPDDLSSLANLPFAEWFTWCMTCKHGGHAHHLVGWFANHSVCPVSGCDCRCQFDGIQKLNRPALMIQPQQQQQQQQQQ
ncbi:GATOR complex protein MIOS [Seminavis robusta]|uniref:GATOR complex protein MIOS n=1 Tax=Seminavis robusta TaxID=568900 RepID=A0A9N8D6U8_9STRA|nr:GATOR complex protein MIOS [Seminavis robusta]|eukprot:Sro2_g001820.1 GATOR complex protein MIOS (1265) ;mRNA; f:253331-257312